MRYLQHDLTRGNSEHVCRTVKIRAYQDRDAAAWDDLVDRAPAGNFLHSRRFLAYHGDRFRDASLIVEHGGEIIAVLPAAIDPQDSSHVISHPGATYGGLIAPGFPASSVVAALLAIARYYRSEGLVRLTYKTVPLHFTAIPSQADRYALWRLGATVTRRDLWSVVWTHEGGETTPRLRRQLRFADRHDLTVFETNNAEDYHRYHNLLSANLDERHDVKPVHNVTELIDLRARLGDSVSLWLVTANDMRDMPLAGVWLFRFGQVAWHTQYIASSPEGRDKRAMHLLLQHLLSSARAAGVAALSYGAVTEQDGHVINPGLERFKVEFGGGLVIHDFLTLSLENDWPLNLSTG